MNEHDILRLWQEQPATPRHFDIDELRRKAQRFERGVRRRNLREYVACVLVAAAAIYFAIVRDEPVTRLGCLVLLTGTAIAAWQLHRRTAIDARDPARLAAPLATHYRDELCRQRDALRSVGWWYVLPLLPGPELMLLGRHLAGHLPISKPGDLAIFLLMPIVGLLVLLLNLHGARQLQRRIDALDKTFAENTP